MFECKYKFEVEDSIISAKRVYKSQKRTKDKVIAILVPVLLVFTIVMMVYDIIKNQSIVLDVILIVALIVLQVMYFLIPIMLVRSQKKAYIQQNLGDMDYLFVKIDENLCVETLFKDEKEMAKNVHNLKQLTSYIEDQDRLILVFNNVEFVCLRKAELTGGLEKLKNHLQKTMMKQTNKK